MGFFEKVGLVFNVVFHGGNAPASLKSLSHSVRNLGQGMGDLGRGSRIAASGLSRIGTTAGIVAVAVGALAKKTVDVFLDFDTEIRKIGAPLGIEAFRRQKTELEKIAQDLGAEFSKMPTEAAAAMKAAAKAGITETEEIQAIARSALKLSVADAEASADQVTNIVLAALKAFNIKPTMETVDRFAGQVFTAVNAAATDVTEFGQAWKYIATTFSQGQQPIEAAIAAVARLSEIGIKGSMAGTSGAMLLSRLGSTAGMKVLDELGVKVTDAAGKFKPLITNLIDIDTAIKRFTSDSAEQMGLWNKLFEVRGGKAAMALVRATKDFDALKDRLTKGGAAELNEGVKIMLEGPSGQLNKIKSLLATIGIQILGVFAGTAVGGLQDFAGLLGQVVEAFRVAAAGGDMSKFSEGVQSFVKGVQDGVQDIRDLGTFLGEVWVKMKGILDSAFFERFGTGLVTVGILSPVLMPVVVAFGALSNIFSGLMSVFVGAVTVAGGIGKLIVGLGGILSSTLALLGPIGLATILVVGLTLGSNLLGDSEGTWNALKDAVGRFWDKLKKGYEAVKPILSKIADNFKKALGPITELATSLGKSLMPVFEMLAFTVGPVLVGILYAISEAFKEILTPITEIAEAINSLAKYTGAGWGDMLKGLASGKMTIGEGGQFVPGRPGVTPSPELLEKPGKIKAPSLDKHLQDLKKSLAPAPTTGSADNLGTLKLAGRDDHTINIKSELKVDGKQIAGVSSRYQTELTERAGSKLSPWQRRRAVERHIAPRTA